MELSLRSIAFNRGNRLVLGSVSATVPSIGLTCLIGTNGAGKTTLLRILCGELRPDSGTFAIGSTDASTMKQSVISRYFSMIPQKSQAPPYLSVAEMVALGRFRPGQGLWMRLNAEDRGRIEEALALCKLADFRDRQVAELSGGEQQRVWVAFALTSDKPFLLLDESFEGMDVLAKRDFFGLVKRVSSRGRAVIMATHDLDMVGEFADRVVVLSQGKVAYEGSVSGDLSRHLSAPGFSESATA